VISKGTLTDSSHLDKLVGDENEEETLKNASI